MKLLLIACLIAYVTAVPIVEDAQFIHNTPNDLLKPLDDIVKEINQEEQDDAQRVQEAKSRVSNRVQEEDDAKKEYDTKEAAMKAAHINLDNQQTLENKREAEYAANNEVRATELKSLTQLKTNLDGLVAVGPADGNLGQLPESKVILKKRVPEEVKNTFLQIASSLNQKSSRPEYSNLVADLQRKGTYTDSLYDDIKSAQTVIAEEDKKDTAEVQVEIELTRTLRDKYDQAEAERVTAKRLWEEAQQRTQIAKDALADIEKAKQEADTLRAEEIKVIQEAKDLIAQLLAVRNTDTSAGQASAAYMQLQIARTNDATAELKKIVAQLKADVNKEEEMQLRVLNMIKAKEAAANAAMRAAEAKYEKQKIETLAAYKRFEKAHGEWEGAEMALAQEQAVAANERKVIGEVRGMLKKLEAASLKTLGNCPTGSDGTVCNGAGECKKEENGLGAKCVCTAYGKTGFDCSLCKFGYKDVDGACTKVFETAVSFLQTDDGRDYSADNLNQMVEDLQMGRTHAEQNRGIEALLAKLEEKLDAQEKVLIVEATKAKDVKTIFDNHWNANKTQEAADKADFEQKTVVWKQWYVKKNQIQSLYDYEHPLRVKELEIIGLLEEVVTRLEGKKVYDGTLAPTPAETKSQYTATKAPTTA
jgi:hypothetical protein